jgi:hypothetical protein
MVVHACSWATIDFTHTEVNIVCTVLYLLEGCHLLLGIGDIR